MNTVPRDTVMDATVADCHHDSASEWGVLDRVLYTRTKLSYPRQKWTKVSRVSYTPKRMCLIARLVEEAAMETVLRELR